MVKPSDAPVPGRRLVDTLLARLLLKDGHDVLVPRQVSLSGQNDAVHFTYAIRNGLVLVSKNHKDFGALQDLVLAAGGRHPGLLIIRQDNDRGKDLTPRGIVLAVKKFEAAGQSPESAYIILNQWR